MMSELFVVHGRVLAGRMTRRRGYLRFVYDQAYRAGQDPTPISLSMPVELSEHTDRSVAPWIAGLLPDNDRVLERWARNFQVANNPFSLLGTPIGEDCAGGFRFVTGERLDGALAQSGDIEWLDEAGVASRLRDLRRDATSWLGEDFAGRFSLAGAQAKTALLYQQGRWGIPSGAAATTHILKPAISGLDDHDLNEHICLRAAQKAGMPAVRTAIETFEDQSVVVTERYDRVPATSGWVGRIHQEDLCQATSHAPQLKYQNEGGPTPREIVGLFRRVLEGPEIDIAVWRFFDALTLNWLIGGTDAHSKNYSLVLHRNQVRLAPLYDIASALPYDLPIQKMRLAMKFGGSYLLTGRDSKMWPAVAKELGLPEQAVVERVASLVDRLPDSFADAVRDPAVQAVESALPHRLIGRVTDRIAAARLILP